MKKGFTLIELLAVIVIIAIITLIATPVISNVVNNSKVGALKSSAYGILEASNLYYAQNGSKGIRFDINENVVSSNDTTKLLNYKGSIKRGTVIIDKKGNTTICITDGTNSAYKNYNDQNVTTVTKETCNIPATSSIVYLENSGATRTELNNQELTNEIASLKEQVNTLTSALDNKANQSDLETVATVANDAQILSQNAATKQELAAIDDKVYKLVKVDSNATYNANGSLIYTGVSVTIPADAYYSLTGHVSWNNGEARGVAILNNTTISNAAGNYCNNLDTTAGNGYKRCVVSGYTNNEPQTFYLFAKNSGGNNYVSIFGYYFIKQ